MKNPKKKFYLNEEEEQFQVINDFFFLGNNSIPQKKIGEINFILKMIVIEKKNFFS